MGKKSFRRRAIATAAAAVAAPHAYAAQYSWDVGEGEGIQATLNSTLTIGGAIRMEGQAVDLVGKANLDPDVCRGVFQSCQGLFRDQTFMADHARNSPGAPTMRADDGNLNYDEGDVFQAVAKLTQDLTLEWNGYTLFSRWLFFYDHVNNDFTENYPNLITAENAERVATRGDAISNRYFSEVYSRGERVGVDRNDGEILRQAGLDLQLMDLNVSGDVPLWGEQEVTLKIGRQTVNWGESLLLAVGSINSINPPNANNLFRVGFQVEEVFTPVGMLFASMQPLDGLTAEAFYEYEWKPLEAPTPGTYFSFADIGTNNTRNFVNLSFGSSADDPDQVGHPLDNPLTLLTPLTTRIGRLPDREPSDGGQFGIALKYYSETFNEGTEFGFYYTHLHSRLPFVSFYSTDASCARREGNARGIDVRNTSEFLAACPNIPGLVDTQARLGILRDGGALILSNPLVAADLGTDPQALLSLILPGDPNDLDDAVPLDTGKIVLEYPEDIDMLGVSFNTTVGSVSLQGELAFRPKQPLQVAIMDLAFAAAGPTLTRCHDQNLGCFGSSGGAGYVDESGTFVPNGYGSSDFVDENGNNPFPDTVNVLLGHGPGSARSFPSFVVPYRGQTLGETPPNSYIRGWEEFPVFTYNLGLTRVLGATENWIGADQVNLILEMGAVHIPTLPSLDELQIEGPGVYTHASAGADGTGADRSRQACSTNPTCSFGPDGLRFNPTQADLDAFVTEFSAGYRVISQIKYESVLPGISIQPLIILWHDVYGVSPGPGENFVEGRKIANVVIETRYHDALSFSLGYSWFTGAGKANLLRDRDFAQAFVKYQF